MKKELNELNLMCDKFLKKQFSPEKDDEFKEFNELEKSDEESKGETKEESKEESKEEFVENTDSGLNIDIKVLSKKERFYNPSPFYLLNDRYENLDKHLNSNSEKPQDLLEVFKKIEEGSKKELKE